MRKINQFKMKKISILLLSIILLASCKEEHPKDFLSLKGKFTNNTDSTFTITGVGLNKTIKINEDGSFKDTMKVKTPEIFTFYTNSNKRGVIFLANGYDLTLNGDAENFMESFKYSGNGAETNNFGISQIQLSIINGNPMDHFALEKEAFDKKIKNLKRSNDSVFNLYKNADTTLVKKIEFQNNRMFEFLEKNYEKQHSQAKKRAELMEKVAKGKPSPKFSNYENFNGGKTSLDDLKGKFVYIDLWATWCKPCLDEIPSLQKIEKAYHDKNIAFVSISVDNERTAKSWENAEKLWKAMVADKNLTGTQLWAGKDDKFMQDYQVTGIPRFILIDPQGNIVDNNAPRPSGSELKKLFTELGI